MGNFDLRCAGESVAVTPAGQRLLSLLALSHRTVTREYVADKLWPDAAATKAAGSLRSTLWRLPKLGHPLVVATAGTLHVADEVETDLDATEHLLNRTIKHAESPARHMPGEAPPDLEPADQALSCDLLPEAWDDWVVVERERLHQMRLHALESLACVHRSAGHFGRALDAALRAVAGEPLRESAHREVIETYLAEGNTGEAMRHFEELRRLLRAELELEPSPALHRLLTDAVTAKRTEP
ncbi:AfsR/SARP family transcriptional regulator [Streptomyces sp. CMB-StM0423]|uniref:AfsR/SARP family transcriptional regulator n=1 Tax=Streptomyces sp. CMB-StM0423 TaxID=2059884 RepID=UPI00131B6AB0|nr:BTAD domain-containing putative transcriptional regulator [Streptomyces sp. CMB-StM0423]